MGSIICPRCGEPRPGAGEACTRCGWRFVPRLLSDYGSAQGSPPGEAAGPAVVVIRPDPWERRQVARWFLAAFEITLAMSLASGLGAIAGGLAGAAIASALGNDLFGIIIPLMLWSVLGGVIGSYLMLRALATW